MMVPSDEDVGMGNISEQHKEHQLTRTSILGHLHVQRAEESTILKTMATEDQSEQWTWAFGASLRTFSKSHDSAVGPLPGF